MQIEKMDEDLLCNMLDGAIAESVEFMNPIIEKSNQADDYYACEPRGDEQEGYSSYTSSQVADLIDADMPTLVRVFLGAGQVLEFQPINKNDPKDAKEAEEKTAYVEHTIKSAPNYFRVVHGALKAVTLHPVSVIRYGYEERKTKTIKEHYGVTVEVATALAEDYRASHDKVEFAEYETETDKDGQELLNVKFRLTKDRDLSPSIRRVPVDNFVMSFDATHKGDARLVGERLLTRRGDLVAAGYSKAKVAEIPTCASGSANGEYGYRRNAASSSVEWASEMVEGFDGFFRCDYDGDGMIEVRHIVKYGNVILENKEIDDDPRAIEFAIGSATLLPDNVVGMSRAERVTGYQDVMTSISRAMLDNTAQVTRGRTIVNTSKDAGVNLFDVTGDSSIIRANPQPGMPLMELFAPLQIQPVAQDALAVIQFLDSQRAQSTGSLLANQGLKEDALHKETATRFQGVDDSAQAKIELVSRVIAETMIKELYEGMCYLAQKYAIKEREIQVLGKPMKVSPNAWARDHSCVATVGTGYGDNQKTMETLNNLLTVSANLQGTGISDAKKLYNLVRKLAMASGIYNVGDYFNDPERPEQMVIAENEALKLQVEQMKQQIAANDPLIAIEKMRQDNKLLEIQLNDKNATEKLLLEQNKLISQNALKLTEMEQAAGKQLDDQLTQNSQSVA